MMPCGSTFMPQRAQVTFLRVMKLLSARRGNDALDHAEREAAEEEAKPAGADLGVVSEPRALRVVVCGVSRAGLGGHTDRGAWGQFTRGRGIPLGADGRTGLADAGVSEVSMTTTCGASDC